MRVDQRTAHALRITASVVLLAACLWLVEFGDVVAAVRGLDPWMFAVAFVLNGVGTVAVRAWIAHLAAIASGITLGPWALLRVNLVARFYTLVLPRGAAAAVRWKHYSEGGAAMAASALLLFETLVATAAVPNSVAVAFVLNGVGTVAVRAWIAHLAAIASGITLGPWALLLFETLVATATLFGTAAVALSLVPERGELARVLLPLSWLFFAISIGSLMPFLHRPSARVAHRINARLLGRSPRLAALARRFTAAVAEYERIPKRTITGIVAVSLFGYVLFVLSAWVLLQAMDLQVGLIAIAWIRSVTLLLALVPISVAGLGVREASFIALLGECGVSSSAAFAFSMATFTIQLLLGAIGALLELSRVFSRPAATS